MFDGRFHHFTEHLFPKMCVDTRLEDCLAKQKDEKYQSYINRSFIT